MGPHSWIPIHRGCTSLYYLYRRCFLFAIHTKSRLRTKPIGHGIDRAVVCRPCGKPQQVVRMGSSSVIATWAVDLRRANVIARAAMVRALLLMVGAQAAAAGFEDVDFARLGPAAIGIWLRKHPQRGPYPAARGSRRGPLKQAVSLRKIILRVNSCAGDARIVDDGRDVQAVGIHIQIGVSGRRSIAVVELLFVVSPARNAVLTTVATFANQLFA